MKPLIVYTTRHGCTEKCVTKLEQYFDESAELIDLKHKQVVHLHDYDTIIIGGSIHAGQIQKSIKKFCQKNMDILKTKKLGLFICCMEEGETAQKEFDNAFPEELISLSSAKGIFGGEFNFERMNFIEKAIIKKVAKIDRSVTKINEQAIHDFAREIKMVK